MSWGLYRNLQASLNEHLTSQRDTENFTAIDGSTIDIRVGSEFNDNWQLPCITAYFEEETLERLEIGSNLRDTRQLIIIDIFAQNEADRLDFAKWVTDTINDGWQYYEYSSNPSNPDSPNKTESGWVSVNFVTNNKVNLGESVDQFDAHRHRISIRVWIT